MPEVVAIHFNDEQIKVDDMVFVELADGRMLLTSGAAAADFSTVVDIDPTVAFQRMLDNRPDFFREVKRRVSEAASASTFTPGAAGFTANLTQRDRARLRQIVLKHHRQYFAGQPTRAQVDQLIDSLGTEVAAKLVKAAVDKGQIG